MSTVLQPISPLQYGYAIVEKSGGPTQQFQRLFNTAFKNSQFILSQANAAALSATWGSIGGTLSDQVDLQAALDAKQPLDADLTAIAALSGTHTIYYRSAANTWTAVAIGTGLDFTGATLSATGSGYTDEQAQDAVGTILTDTSTIDFTYNDGAGTITADVKAGSIGATELTSTAVTPGSYTSADITVDADGRITAAANGAGGGSGTTTNPLTMNNGGAGAASGSTFDGSAAKTISYNTIGAAPNIEGTISKPASASYTLQNTGTASVSDVSNGMLLTAPATVTAEIRFLKHTAGPGSFSTFSIICRVRPVCLNGTGIASYNGAIILRNSSSGKIIIFSNGYKAGSQYLAQRWSAYATFSANSVAPAAYQGYATFPWMKINVAGGTITFYVSPDGVNFFSLGTESVATYISSIDEAGVGTMSSASEPATCVFQSVVVA